MSERRGAPIELNGIVLIPVEDVRTHRILGWYRTERRCVALIVPGPDGERRIDLPW